MLPLANGLRFLMKRTVSLQVRGFLADAIALAKELGEERPVMMKMPPVDALILFSA